jgi:hypothetical protein
LKLGDFFVDGGLGFGFGGTRLTFFGTTSARLWTISFLLKPQARVGYRFLSETEEGGFIVSLNTAYNYLPAAGWNLDGGIVASFPQPFDLSGFSADVSIAFPFATK